MEIEIERLDVTEEVLQLHMMEDGEKKERERNRLLRITEELIYLIPIRNGYLMEADASGFYLAERKNAGKILDAYRISKLPYPDYVGQIMRIRVRNYLLHKNEVESDIKRLHYAERVHQDSITVMDLEEAYEAGNRNPLPMIPDSRLEDLTIREAFNKVMKETSRKRYPDKALNSKGLRLGLLCLLLALPKGEGYDFTDHYSDLLRVREESVIAILHLRDLEDETRSKRIDKHREVIGKHFKILLRLNTAYKLSDDDEEKEKLNEVSIRLENLIARRCERMRKENAGYTQRELAAILGISRSTICSDMRKARNFLTSLSPS